MSSVFLSHNSLDKPTARAIYDILKSKGISVYLDERDPNLQVAVSTNDHNGIVQSIESGIAECSNVLVLISPNSQKSWWVPYEIGYGRSLNKDLAYMAIKDVNHIPSFLQISKRILDKIDLQHWINKILFDKENLFIKEAKSIQVPDLPNVRINIDYV